MKHKLLKLRKQLLRSRSVQRSRAKHSTTPIGGLDRGQNMADNNLGSKKG